MAQSGLGVGLETELCDPNCGTMDCHSYGCIILCSEAPNKQDKSNPSVYTQVATEQQEKVSRQQRKVLRTGFVK